MTEARSNRFGAACALVGGVWLALGAGCGGASKEAAPTSAPANAGAAKTESMGPGYPSPTSPPPPPPPTAATVPVVPGPPARAQAVADLDRATRELDLAANDCGSACRALASLERATARLCELADEPDDRAKCDDAKKKLRAARDRVRSSCSSCPGGPSVDRDAPIPSR